MSSPVQGMSQTKLINFALFVYFYTILFCTSTTTCLKMNVLLFILIFEEPFYGKDRWYIHTKKSIISTCKYRTVFVPKLSSVLTLKRENMFLYLIEYFVNKEDKFNGLNGVINDLTEEKIYCMLRKIISLSKLLQIQTHLRIFKWTSK